MSETQRGEVRMTSSGRLPAYRQLAERMKHELLAGVYPPGVQLPTEAELVESEQTSRSTVRQALRELVAEGLVYRVPGRGTFPVPRTLRTRSMRINGYLDEIYSVVDSTQLLLLSGPVLVEAAREAELLGVAGFTVAQFRALRLDEGVPFSLFTASIAPETAELLPAGELVPGIPSSETISGLVGKALGRPVALIEQSINAAACPGDVAGYLGLDPGDPCLSIERSYFDRDRRPLEIVHAFHNSDRYNYEIHLTQRR